MEHRLYITFLFYLMAMQCVSGMPAATKDMDSEMKQGEDIPCMDMSTWCQGYKNKTYVCDKNEWSSGYKICKKTCGLCNPSDDEVSFDGVPTCVVQYTNKKVTYPKGMRFTNKCMSCNCGGLSTNDYGCTDIHCDAFELPSQACEWNPPENPDSCCPVPSCPDGIEITFPPYWSEV